MQVFEQNGNEVFVMKNLIDLFSVRPKHLPLLMSDVAVHITELQNVGLASALMRQMVDTDQHIPGDEFLWISDDTMEPGDRMMVVMNKTPNDEGGFDYSARSINELEVAREGEAVNTDDGEMTQERVMDLIRSLVGDNKDDPNDEEPDQNRIG